MPKFAVTLERCGGYDFSRDMREQVDWDAHAQFMDQLAEEGFILLGGPLADGVRTFHVVDAPTEEGVRRRLAEDPWAGRLLRVADIQRWEILLQHLRVRLPPDREGVRHGEFEAVHVDRAERWALERDPASGRAFVSFPVSNPYTDYLEYYEIDAATFERFAADPDQARGFVDLAKRRQLDHLLLLAPGRLRGHP